MMVKTIYTKLQCSIEYEKQQQDIGLFEQIKRKI